MEEDNFSLSEMKPNDRVRRDEIIETLNELGVINMRQAQQIFNSKMPTNPRFYLGSPKSKGFILVNNHLGFPPGMDLSPCFIDYLNFRCHSGEILSRLLSRRGKYHFKIFMWLGKGVAQLKSAATPFFYNPGTVGSRKIKFIVWIDN